MRFSSSFKVGILTIVALCILLSTILWVKGRSFSAGKRVEIVFRDVDGMRPGSGVQMMGLRVGQVEEIIPVIKGDESCVKLRFVITEPGVTIPRGSIFSIQQSGIIGEQFLEITPPKIRTVYIPMVKSSDLLYKNDPVEIKLDKKYYEVGHVRDTSITSTKMIPAILQEKIKTKYVYKIDYIVNLPGLVLPDYMNAQIVKTMDGQKMRISMTDGSVLPYPNQDSPYTVVEPMRISDFLDLQYKAAESLTETTIKVNALLSDDVIGNLQQSVANINKLTARATTTMDKAEKLIDSSRKDLDEMTTMASGVSNSFIRLSDNINNVVGDEKFKPSLMSTMNSVDRLSKNLNKVLDNVDAQRMASDLQAITQNVNDISNYVCTMTKDDKLKKQLTNTVNKVNTAMTDISNALSVVNSMSPAQKAQVQQIIEDSAKTTHNLRLFTDKLNKRFLLFRLMF